MPLDILAPQPHEMTAFDEARAQIDAWEQEFPDSERLVLILEAPEDLLVYNTGEVVKPSAIAGVCFMAAQVVADDE